MMQEYILGENWQRIEGKAGQLLQVKGDGIIFLYRSDTPPPQGRVPAFTRQGCINIFSDEVFYAKSAMTTVAGYSKSNLVEIVIG